MRSVYSMRPFAVTVLTLWEQAQAVPVVEGGMSRACAAKPFVPFEDIEGIVDDGMVKAKGSCQSANDRWLELSEFVLFVLTTFISSSLEEQSILCH
jgi:hypothetical protein